MPTAEIRIVPRLLREFRKRYPQVEVGLHPLNPGEQVEALRHSRIDLALTRRLLDEGITFERFLRESLLLAVARGHPLARSTEVRLDSLRDMPLLLFPRADAPVLHDTILGFFRSAVISKQVTYAVTSIHGGLGLVAAGIGVALVPESMEDLRFKGVAYRRLSRPVPTVDMGVARLAEEMTPLQESFLKVLRDLYPKRPSPSRSSRR